MMDTIGVGEHHSMIQHWQRMAGQHHDNPYNNQHLMLQQQTSIDTQQSPSDPAGPFSYSAPNDGKFYSLSLLNIYFSFYNSIYIPCSLYCVYFGLWEKTQQVLSYTCEVTFSKSL